MSWKEIHEFSSSLLCECGFSSFTPDSKWGCIYLRDSEYVQGDTICPFYIGRWVGAFDEKPSLQLLFYLFSNEQEDDFFMFNKVYEKYRTLFEGKLFDGLTKDSIYRQIKRMDRDLRKRGFTRIA